MTINDLLKELFNLTDEQLTQLAPKMKENKIFTAGEENLDVRYGKLKTDHDGTVQQLNEANNLISELKKSNKGNEDLQGKITGYENQVTELQKELQQTKLDAAVKVALLSEKATDVDYMTFKLKEKGELELDENEKIKGWEDKIAALKVQFPTQFESSTSKKVEEHKLEQGNEEKTLTKSEILKMPYNKRMEIYNQSPEAYKTAMEN